ncbi:MAG: 30S ribosomal protein S4 [Euryarchaeota archaeon]|nr:30S ribosomal protein S4 [Euryarchaeota archaeon]
MGDPRRMKKKYDKPKHPWRGERIEAEKKILKNYGLKNKRELWRMETILRGFRRQARRLQGLKTEQARKEEAQVLARLQRMNLLKEGSTLDDVLALKINHILDRRLQTLVHRRGLTATVGQARQLIVHGHIAVGGSRVTAPSYLVERGEEEALCFTPYSPMKDRPLVVREEPAKAKEAAEPVEEGPEARPEEPEGPKAEE